MQYCIAGKRGVGASLVSEEPIIYGETLRALRDEVGWTQGELAYHAKVDQSLISKIERGQVDNVNLRTAIFLARALGVSIDILASPPKPAIAQSQEETATAAKEALIQQINRDRHIRRDTKDILATIVEDEYAKHLDRKRKRQGEED